MKEYIALDIGGTKFMVASYTETLEEIKRVKYNTPGDLKEGLDLLHRMIGEVTGGNPIGGIGAAIDYVDLVPGISLGQTQSFR